MYNIGTYVARENMMSHVRTCVAYKMCNVRTYVTHEYAIIFCRNLCYMRKCVMSEHKLYTNMRCILPDLLLHTKI